MNNDQRTILLQVSSTILLSLASIPNQASGENHFDKEDLMVKKAVRMADALIKEVANFKLDE